MSADYIRPSFHSEDESKYRRIEKLENNLETRSDSIIGCLLILIIFFVIGIIGYILYYYYYIN